MEVFSEIGSFDCSRSIYPSELHSIKGYFVAPESWFRSTIYGFSLGLGFYQFAGKKIPLFEGSFFSLPLDGAQGKVSFEIDGQICLFVRHGFLGQSILLGMVEQKGRLTYLDGCSDSLLVYPPRLGDASLNLLYLPGGTNQSAHTHPTIRLGLVIEGVGWAETKHSEFPLKRGDAFMIKEHQFHRFKTEEDSFLRVVAFHPDGDFGPTDQNHSMINRSYVAGKVFE